LPAFLVVINHVNFSDARNAPVGDGANVHHGSTNYVWPKLRPSLEPKYTQTRSWRQLGIGLQKRRASRPLSEQSCVHADESLPVPDYPWR
jgi:hypothetical protein